MSIPYGWNMQIFTDQYGAGSRLDELMYWLPDVLLAVAKAGTIILIAVALVRNLRRRR